MSDESATFSGEQSHRTKGLVRLTMACNERCPFCNVPQEDYPRLTPPDDDVMAQLDDFVSTGSQTLTISGGEPTLLRKKLVALVKEGRARGIPFVELQTNAVLITDEYARELAEAGVTSAFVSLLSHVPEHHDALAGLADAFPRCLRGIDAMLDAGIAVTLNPVTARRTQALVADYVEFVGTRLPRIKFISMSAVQPHGRARGQSDLLLPDYDVLKTSIREARARADAHGISLLNPYCGLPLCVGWDDDLDSSVEAFEAEGGGWRETPGLDNVGNKAHGAPCARCALRTRCGGAWHDYWDVRGGRGLQAPLPIVEPWSPGADVAPGQLVVACKCGVSEAALAQIDASSLPTRWVWTDTLRRGDDEALLRSHTTDLALELDSVDPDAHRATLTVLRKLIGASASLQPQVRLRVFLGVRAGPDTNPAALLRVLGLGAALGVDAVRVLDGSPRCRKVVEVFRATTSGFDAEAVASRAL